MEDKMDTASPRATETPMPVPTRAAPTFLGNSNDVLAVVAATIGGVTAFSCLTLNYGVYCLPLLAVTLGAVAIANANASVVPDRTRRWGWISVGFGGVSLLLILILIACAAVFYGALFAAALQGAGE